MRRGWHKGGAAILQRIAKRVLDFSGGHFVVAREAGENGESRGVGRSPGEGALPISQKIPEGCRICVPASVSLRNRTVKLIQPTGTVVEDEYVPIARARIGKSFNLGIRGNRHRA